MKKRTIMISLVVLGFLLMIGVGFAAWTITNPNSGGTSEAQIEVYQVENKNYQLTFAFVESTATEAATVSSPKITFGKPNPLDPETPVWLSADSSVGNEALTVYLKVSVDYKENLPDTLPITFACTKATEWSACTTANYLSGPTYQIGGAPVTSIAKSAFGEGTGAGSCVLAITFAWGSAFDAANPYTYYNGKTFTSTLATEATAALTAIYGLNEAKYQFTIGNVQSAE